MIDAAVFFATAAAIFGVPAAVLLDAVRYFHTTRALRLQPDCPTG